MRCVDPLQPAALCAGFPQRPSGLAGSPWAEPGAGTPGSPPEAGTWWVGLPRHGVGGPCVGAGRRGPQAGGGSAPSRLVV